LWQNNFLATFAIPFLKKFNMRNILLISAAITVLLWASCKKDDDNKELIAAFDWVQTEEPGQIVFTNKSKNAASYEWDFDDGGQGMEENPTRIYKENGIYTVTLKAFGGGNVKSVQDSVIVNNIPKRGIQFLP
jgi:hypothetical protein